LRKETADPVFEQSHQLRIHELVVVGNVEANDTLALQMRAKLTGQLAAMSFFHDENDVGPIDLSEDNNTLAPDEMPAESVSTPGQVENTCSAVGLRRRLALQTNRTFITLPRCHLQARYAGWAKQSVPTV
jgi:hypothetical protein